VKLTVTQLVKKFPALYGTRSLITVFTRARHWLLFSARCIQSTPFHLNIVYPIHVCIFYLFKRNLARKRLWTGVHNFSIKMAAIGWFLGFIFYTKQSSVC